MRFNVFNMFWCFVVLLHVSYASDGASRGQGSNTQDRQASIGSIMYAMGGTSLEARCGQRLGDQTNNEAEDVGLTDGIQHALLTPLPVTDISS